MSIYEFTVKNASGEDVSMETFKGQALLIVNTASACGFTPQYDDLEKLYEKYKAQGFTVLGFPCNQFGNQESGSDAEIQEFCRTRFDIKFPVFQKIEVNGSGAHPLYEHLKAKAPGVLGSTAIKWNFTKFLVSRDGETIVRYAPATKPMEVEDKLQEFLAANG